MGIISGSLYQSPPEYLTLTIDGLAAGKEFILLNHLSILPEVGALKISRERTNNQETGFSPVFSLRLLYLFPSESPQFQIGFTLKEIFDEEIDVDFLDIGIGF
ncbi:unnamed protein product, partial [marine sediment metagenome]